MITYITIEHFKSLRKIELDLRPINVLIGANGAGKSNFINFFKFVHYLYAQKLQAYIGNNIDALLYFGRKTSPSLKGILEFIREENSSEKNAVCFTIAPQPQSNKCQIQATGDYYNFGKFQNHDYAAWHYVEWDSNVEESCLCEQRKWRAQYIKQYLESFRVYHFHDTSDASPMKQAALISQNRYLYENGANLAAYLYYLQEAHPSILKKIEMIVRSVAPFFDRFDLQPDRLNPQTIELQWLEQGSETPFTAYFLSDGTLRFIALVTLLLQPEPPKTILIDEPELGLHPFAINKLAGLLKKASAQSQIIVSTQSVNLVDNFEPEDIVTVDRNAQTSFFCRHGRDTLGDWLKEYSLGDLWNKNVIGGRP